METWRKGSFRNASFFKRLTLGRPRPRLRRQGSILSQASTAAGDHEEYSNREVIRELRGRPDGRRLPLWGDEHPRATLLAPPKPPRLYRESSSCPNILEPPAAYTAAYSATLPSAISLTGPFHRGSEEDLVDTPHFPRTPTPDLNDPFFSFKVDLGISLLEEVLEMLREQFPGEPHF
ncbi:uncharacterized protein C15orf62 homolog, mitochondrial [Peromyscus maniculatus bairdii]|uniref:uncharacterized protein C15orf62 homolog, mitochondrial n=1 Tax=Peromyscus maniculatus bairdii TaxID=230844 RepID=UPI003FD21649